MSVCTIALAGLVREPSARLPRGARRRHRLRLGHGGRPIFSSITLRLPRVRR